MVQSAIYIYLYNLALLLSRCNCTTRQLFFAGTVGQEVKGALDPQQMTDVLTAYSAEQGRLKDFSGASRPFHAHPQTLARAHSTYKGYFAFVSQAKFIIQIQQITLASSQSSGFTVSSSLAGCDAREITKLI